MWKFENWFKKAYQLVWEFLSWLEVSILMHLPLLAVPLFQFFKIRLFLFLSSFFLSKSMWGRRSYGPMRRARGIGWGAEIGQTTHRNLKSAFFEWKLLRVFGNDEKVLKMGENSTKIENFMIFDNCYENWPLSVTKNSVLIVYQSLIIRRKTRVSHFSQVRIFIVF